MSTGKIVHNPHNPATFFFFPSESIDIITEFGLKLNQQKVDLKNKKDFASMQTNSSTHTLSNQQRTWMFNNGREDFYSFLPNIS